MGLGGTAKKLQKVTNAAEDLYAKMNEVVGQLKEVREEVEQTSEQVDRIEYQQARQRALIYAIAEADGIDVEGVLEDADLPPAPDGAAGGTAETAEEDEPVADAADGGTESGA